MKKLAQILFEPMAYKHQIIDRKDILDGYILKFFILILFLLEYGLILYLYSTFIELLPSLIALAIGTTVTAATSKRMYREAKELLSVYPAVKDIPVPSRLNYGVSFIIMYFIFLGIGFMVKPILSFANMYLSLQEKIDYFHLKDILYYSSMTMFFVFLGWMMVGFTAIYNIQVKKIE